MGYEVIFSSSEICSTERSSFARPCRLFRRVESKRKEATAMLEVKALKRRIRDVARRTLTLGSVFNYTLTCQ